MEVCGGGCRVDVIGSYTNPRVSMYEVKWAYSERQVSDARAQIERYVAGAEQDELPYAELGRGLRGTVFKYQANGQDWWVWVPEDGIILFREDSKLKDSQRREIERWLDGATPETRELKDPRLVIPFAPIPIPLPRPVPVRVA